MPVKKEDKANSTKKIKKVDEQKRPEIVTTKVNKFVSCPFTDDEIIVKAKEVAFGTQAIGRVEREKKRANDQFKEQLTRHQSEVDRLSEEINQGYEMRHVDCEKLINYKKETVVITRTDTGEVIEDRALEPHERQMELPKSKPGEEGDDTGADPDKTGDDNDKKD